jgi:hypothetical protein
VTGPEHYQHAEGLLDCNGDCGCEGNCETCAWRAAKAQVHATLALAAATAIPGPGNGYVNADWMEAAGGAS